MRWGCSLLPSVRSHQLPAFAMMGVSTFRIHRHRLFPPLCYSWRLRLVKLQGLREAPVDHFLILLDSAVCWPPPVALSLGSTAPQQLHSSWQARRPSAPGPGTPCCLRLEKLHPPFEVLSGSKSSIVKGQWLQNLNLDVKQALIHCS